MAPRDISEIHAGGVLAGGSTGACSRIWRVTADCSELMVGGYVADEG